MSRTTIMMVVGWLMLVTPALAQSRMEAASTLHVIVLDPSTNVLSGIEVVVETPKQGRRWSAITNALGQCAFTLLPSGSFDILLNVVGFKPAHKRVTIKPGLKSWVTIQLEALDRDPSVAEEITVIGKSASPRVGSGTVFTRDDLDALPTNGRSLQNFLSLAPGVVVTESAGTLAQFTALGQPRISNRLTIDGVSADVAVDVRGLGIGVASGILPGVSALGGQQTLIPNEAIDTMEVRTAAAVTAETRTPGAQTIILSRAGGPRWTGSGFLDARPTLLAASDWFTNAALATKQRPRYRNVGSSAGDR